MESVQPIKWYNQKFLGLKTFWWVIILVGLSIIALALILTGALLPENIPAAPTAPTVAPIYSPYSGVITVGTYSGQWNVVDYVKYLEINGTEFVPEEGTIIFNGDGPTLLGWSESRNEIDLNGRRLYYNDSSQTFLTYNPNRNQWSLSSEPNAITSDSNTITPGYIQVITETDGIWWKASGDSGSLVYSPCNQCKVKVKNGAVL